jgi:hypothetical protein
MYYVLLNPNNYDIATHEKLADAVREANANPASIITKDVENSQLIEARNLVELEGIEVQLLKLHERREALLLKQVVETATDFLTIDELIDDYEEQGDN